MIAFKNLRALDDWAGLHTVARQVVEFILDKAWPTDREVIVTRIAEPDANQVTAIHTCGPPHRAVDFRVSNLPEQTAQRVRTKINEAWVYDSDRPAKMVAILHDAGSGNHLHVQVSDKTARRA